MANIDLEEGRRQGREEVRLSLLAALDELAVCGSTSLAALPYLALVGKWISRRDFQAPRREAEDTRRQQLDDLGRAARMGGT